ncbi:hypothetical protein L3Q67_01745 [Saccharothrix sp. AJ9571]|nr:hypothetical protein L3Q67_01745 [Saccharothrix sp. AJ9571]
MAEADLVHPHLLAYDQELGGVDDRTTDALARVLVTPYHSSADDNGYTYLAPGPIPTNPRHLWAPTAPADPDTAPHERRPLDYLTGYLLRRAGRGPVPRWPTLWLHLSPGRIMPGYTLTAVMTRAGIRYG